MGNIYSCFKKERVTDMIPWFGSYGIGMIMSLMMNHNLVEINETLGWNTKLGSLFLSGYLVNYISLYSFNIGDDHCCPEDKTIQECDQIQIVTNQPINHKHATKHWSISIIIGDSLCNFTDGVMITSAFLQ